MRVHAYHLRFLTPVSAPPRASTLFGHLAWMVHYIDGDGALTRLLERFKTAPPFLLSSAFPAGHLPKPRLPPVDDARLLESRFRKAAKRVDYLSLETFARVAAEGERAFLDSPEVQRALEGLGPSPSLTLRLRVGIDRQSGTAREGALFTEEAYRLQQRTFYVRFLDDTYSPIWLEARLKAIGLQGYGGRSSVGLGRFEVVGVETVDLPEADGANAYTTLSPFVPANANGYYDLEPYWGRLGGHFSYAETPFKRPYLRAVEGSTFRGEAGTAGVLLDVTPATAPEEGVAVYEYAYAFPLGVRL